MNNIDYQKLYEQIAVVLPTLWIKVVFRVEYREGSYTMKYYVEESEGKYIDCYSISGVEENDIVKAYKNIDKLLFPEWKKLSPDKRWSLFTLVIKSDGSFKADLSYDDLEKDYEESTACWKKTYLV